MSNKKKKNHVRNKFIRDNFNLLAVIIFAILSAAFITISYVLLAVPIFACGAFVILEALLAICLKKVPVFVHIFTIAFQIGLGIYFGAVVFVVLMVILYLVSMFLLAVWDRA